MSWGSSVWWLGTQILEPESLNLNLSSVTGYIGHQTNYQASLGISLFIYRSLSSWVWLVKQCGPVLGTQDGHDQWSHTQSCVMLTAQDLLFHTSLHPQVSVLLAHPSIWWSYSPSFNVHARYLLLCDATPYGRLTKRLGLWRLRWVSIFNNKVFLN